MSRKQTTEWVCKENNPSCPLKAEFGQTCQSLIRHRKCRRPESSIPGGFKAMTMIFVARQRAAKQQLQPSFIGV